MDHVEATKLAGKLKTLKEFVSNNTDILEAIHTDADDTVSDELHYALSCLGLAEYHLSMAITELEDEKE